MGVWKKKKVITSASVRANVKVTNKWVNKMAKRGKLRKVDKSKMLGRNNQFWQNRIREKDETLDNDLRSARQIRDKYSNFDTSEDDSDQGEDATPMDMIDSDDELLKQPPIKQKRCIADEEISEEKQPRSFTTGVGELSTSLKHLLPIKTNKGRLIPIAIPNDEQEIKEEDNEEVKQLGVNDETDSKESTSVHLSTAELFAKRSNLMEDCRKNIASMSRRLIEDPHEHVNKLKDLLILAQGAVDPLIQFTVQKLATASLLEIYLDIIPMYYIRPWTEKEETQKVKKETKRLHQFEESLLRNYKKFLQHLESLCKYYQTQKLRQNGYLLPPKIAQQMALLAVKGFCRLLVQHPHFNYRSNILTVIVPLMNNKSEEVSTCVYETVVNVFKMDKLGEVSLDAVKILCLFVKKNTFKTQPRMLEVLLSLKIKEVEKQPEGMTVKEKLLARKRKMKMMSRKEKKFQKRMEQLDNELKELEAEENKQTVLKLHTRIMNHIFTTYFRVLKKCPRSNLLAPVLEGLSKFAHLISVEFFDDLINSLMGLINSEDLKPLEILHCIKTVFVILSGEGQALTIDPYRFYRSLYTLLPKIIQKSNTNNDMFIKQFSLSLECLDAMINGRRKQVTLPRVAAFVKKLVVLTESMDSPAVASTLLIIRSFFLSHPRLNILLDSETFGSGQYLPDLSDPDHCNAITTNILTELNVLKTNTDNTIRQLAFHLLNELPSEGAHSIRRDIAEMKPWVLFERMQIKKSSTNTVPVEKVLNSLHYRINSLTLKYHSSTINHSSLKYH